tara:strand:+ start:3474 stop:5417 length:1944 start_codon:yes stop_codon:yes gene_type:complete
MIKVQQLKIIKIIFLLFIIIVPFSISDFSDQIRPEKITSDLRFYEINTCSISLNEFLIENPNVIYQDHYKIRFNNYSSISCFGQITGIDQIGYTFYISIGTNTILNLFLQSIFWLLLISLFPKKKDFELKNSIFFSNSFTAFIICVVIYAEQRYYSKVLFELDINKNRTLLFLFVYFFFIGFFSFYVIQSRDDNLLNFLPFTYILIGVYSGMNIYFLTIFFCIIGTSKILKDKKIRKYFSLINILVFFWAFNAVGLNYYLKPDKIRGLSSTAYNFLSVSSWSYLMIISILGMYVFVSERKVIFKLEKLKNNFILTSIIIIIFGYIGSSMPVINFYNYYFFGQTKYGTDDQNLFGVNFWGETEAWRGYFPSAETIGEFFALGLILIFLTRKSNKKFERILILGVPTLIIGLYASNNKAALISLLLCFALSISYENKLKTSTKLLLVIPVLFVLGYFIRFENFLYSLNFSTNKMIEMGIGYGNESFRSSSINYLQNLDESFFLIRLIILIFGFFAFLINRSELWGIFFARYNPETIETFFGSGPFILANHYSEINILDKKLYTGTPLGFLLPHSSILSIMLFFGLIGLLIFFVYVFYILNKGRKTNTSMFLICLFILLNILKSDSILYMPSFFLYLTMFVSLKKSKKII